MYYSYLSPDELVELINIGEKRDYFAAQAMGAGIRRYDGSKFGGGQNAPDYKELAEESYYIADAMMKARENSNE
ncbi:hypothetical protein KKJ06_20185 [Xenorhabdus bovienii]|nr:hypothetical protein [Xenorhabdus bovienii]